jgi:hypothetical protein
VALVGGDEDQRFQVTSSLRQLAIGQRESPGLRAAVLGLANVMNAPARRKHPQGQGH